MKPLKPLLAIVGLSLLTNLHAQNNSRSATVSLFTGMINYHGDLNPNSFTFSQSNFAAGVTFRKPINRWFAARAGFNIGSVQSADRYNRDYLQPRNLSFFTSIKELYAGLELTVLDISSKRFSPYMYGGIAVFHFNPWTFDNAGNKTFLKPLSTEGQGLAEFPDQKPYNLAQISLPFGVGLKYALNDAVNIGIEFSQRKSFTDYIDDVSSHFVDKDILLQARGSKAVELAYRGDELPGGMQSFPAHGEQRGTPTEMDWYYFFGTTLEIKLNAIGNLFSRSNKGLHGSYSLRCPRNVSY